MSNSNPPESPEMDNGLEIFTENSKKSAHVMNLGQETVDKVNSESSEGVQKQESLEVISLKKIEALYENLSRQISDLEQLFNNRIMHADYEDRVIDQMHAELQKYRENLYLQLVRPVLLDVIEVRDSIIRMAANYLKRPEGEQNIPNKVFADYAYDLQDILEKNNVQIYRSKREETFTPVKQRIVKKIATNDEFLHGKIEESLSDGYSYEGQVISAEKVSIYIYEDELSNEGESEGNVNG